MSDEVQVDVGAEEPVINVQDLAECVNMIDLCSERGAFKGTELSAVGALRQRLVVFLNAYSEEVEEETGEADE